jgi:predicted RNA-binding protein with RPS1 domain
VDDRGRRYPIDSRGQGEGAQFDQLRRLCRIGGGDRRPAARLRHVVDAEDQPPSEMLEKGQEVECRVLSVDQERRRIALGLKQLDQDPWAHDIPTKYQPGQVVKGTVTKITNFGVFVGLEDGLEGLLHISELADHKVENPEEIVKVGEEIEVKILRVDTEDRKIGLSRKRVEWYMVELLSKWRRANARLTEELGRTPTPEEIARVLGLPARKSSRSSRRRSASITRPLKPIRPKPGGRWGK